MALPNRKRDHDSADNHGEDHDRQTEIQEEYAVKEHQAIDHRLDDQHVPYVDNYLQNISLNGLSSPVVFQRQLGCHHLRREPTLRQGCHWT